MRHQVLPGPRADQAGLARQWHSVPIEAFGALLSMALASVWTLVAARSACALRRGETCR